MIEKEWIKKVKSVHPKADGQVLQFIYDFRTMQKSETAEDAKSRRIKIKMSNILKRRGKEKRKKLEAGLVGDMLPPGTMLVSFKKYMLDEPDSIDRVLDYLNIRSAILSGLVDKDHEFDADERQEMYDFYDYFLENYDDKTKLARMERWNGEEPFIIQAIQNLYDQDNEVYRSDLDERMSAKAKIETAALVDRILNIKKEKVISIVIGSDN